jgi:phasin
MRPKRSAFVVAERQGRREVGPIAIDRMSRISFSFSVILEATALIRNSYLTAVKGAQDYNAMVIEFANANTEAAFAFAQKLSGVKSPSDFIELSTDHSRKQFETLTEQTKELAALAQKVTLARPEPFKTGVTKEFSLGAWS